MTDSTTTKPTLDALHAASEEDLAGRVQVGCNQSFEVLVERLQPRLFFVLRRRLGNYADAEDVAQKTLLRAYEKIHLYDTTRKFSPWLFSIAIRLAADHYRKRQLPTEGTGELAVSVADQRSTPEQLAIEREHSIDLWDIAEQVLKPDQWTALWLLYGEGHAVKEIAQTLNRTAVSVRVMLFRARKALAPHLAEFAEFVDEATFQQDSVDYDDVVSPLVVRAN